MERAILAALNSSTTAPTEVSVQDGDLLYRHSGKKLDSVDIIIGKKLHSGIIGKKLRDFNRANIRSVDCEEIITHVGNVLAMVVSQQEVM